MPDEEQERIYECKCRSGPHRGAGGVWILPIYHCDRCGGYYHSKDREKDWAKRYPKKSVKKK